MNMHTPKVVATKSKLDWALFFAGLGMPIHRLVHTDPDGRCSCGSQPDAEGKLFIPDTDEPCSPGKHPLPGVSWLKDRTIDPAKIRRWFTQDPKMNYGISGGNGFTIIDPDMKQGKNGIREVAKLLDISDWSVSSQTFTVRTPTGGRHLFYRDVDDRSNNEILPGVDCKSRNGYVVGAGSVIYLEKGFETFEAMPYDVINNVPMVEIPARFITVMKKSKERAENAGESSHPDTEDSDASRHHARDLLKRRKPAVWGQGGEHHTLVTAMKVKDCNISEDVCFELMTEPGGWNDRCVPLWDDEELKIKIANAYKYGKEAIGSKRSLLDEVQDDSDSELPEDVRNVLYPEQFQRIELSEVTEAKAREKSLYQQIAANLFTSEELDAQTGLTEFLIDGWIPFEGSTYIFGKRGGGKTAVVVDLCLSGQADMKWLGVHEIEKGCTFIYIALEHPTGVNTAIQAWLSAHPEVEINPRRFKICTYPINAFADNASKIMKTLAQVIRDTMDHKRVIFIIDTQQRFAPGSQNDGDPMAKASAGAEAYAREFKGASIVLGHSPKSNEETLSGSGILENNSFALISLNKTDARLREMRVLRVKDAPEHSYTRFEIKGFEIPGLDKQGNRKSGPVVVYSGGSVDAAKGLLEREQAATADAAMLAEDLQQYLPVGEHSLDHVAKTCGGKPGGIYKWLPGSEALDRKIASRASLHIKIKALMGRTWPIAQGTYELEVMPGNGGTGPGSGSKVVIRKLVK